jgi:hypothetical protein
MVECYDAELLWPGDREDPTTPDYLMQVTPRFFLTLGPCIDFFTLNRIYFFTLNRSCRSS